MPAPENLEWIEINDFSPGIYGSRINSIVPNAPLGSCRYDSYGAAVGVTGALQPGPFNTAGYGPTMPGTGTRPDSTYKWVSLAAHIVPSLIAESGNNVTESGFGSFGLLVDWSQFLDAASGVAYAHRNDMVFYPVGNTGSFSPTPYTIDTMSTASGAYSGIHHGWAGFASGIEDGSPATRMTVGFHTHRNSATAPVARAFPDPAAPNTNADAGVTLTGIPWGIVGHQGRYITASHVATTFDYFGLDGSLDIAADLAYWPVRNAVGGGAQTTFVGPFEEALGSIEVMASNSANELFLVKSVGGGGLIRGDIDQPNVIRVPNFHSTFGARNVPVSTPIGLVYGTATGVVLWAGGESTQQISDQIIDGWRGSGISNKIPFWDVMFDESPYVGYNPYLVRGNLGSFGYSAPYVWVPNNWLYDVRHNSWWRLGPSSLPKYAHWCATPDGNMIGVSQYVNDSQAIAFSSFYSSGLNNFGGLPSSYEWNSQPIVPAQHRQVSVRTVEIIAHVAQISDAATIVVNITGQNQQGNATTTLSTMTFTALSSPNMQRANCDIPCDSFILDIDAANVVISAIRIGYTQSTRPPAA